MNKIMSFILTIALVFSLTSCLPASKEEAETKPDEGAESSENDQEENEEESLESDDDGVISAEYEATKPFPIIQEHGKYYFDFTAEELIERVNETNEELMNTPFYFSAMPADAVKKSLGTDEYVGAVGDNNLLMLIKVNKKNNKIEAIMVGVREDKLPAGEDNALNFTAICSAGILTVLDPNMTPKYAALHLVDIAMAGMFSYSEDMYAYDSQVGEIGYTVVKMDETLLLCFVPTSPKEEDEATETAKKQPTMGTGGNKTFSDDIYDAQVEVDGIVYQLPMKYSELVDLGWVLDGDAKTLVRARSKTIVNRFKNGKDSTFVDITNFDINERPLDECYVTGIKFDAMDLKEEGTVVKTTGGIELLKSTSEDVKSAYGTPSYEYKTDSGSISIEYSKGYDVNIKFYFFEQDKGLLTSVDVTNSTEPTDFIKSDANNEIPSFVKNYKTPAKASTNLEDYIVTYGGALYKLPAPVSAFEANGWKNANAKDENTVSGLNSGWVTLTKDNQELSVLATNYADNATNMSNCYITEITSSIYSNKTPLVIAGGITLDMTEKDMLSALNKLSAKYEKDNSGSSSVFYSVEFESYGHSYDIGVDKETGKVMTISVTNDMKKVDLLKLYE